MSSGQVVTVKEPASVADLLRAVIAWDEGKTVRFVKKEGSQ